MAKNTIAARWGQSKRDIRATLTAHEIALVAELVQLYSWRGAARRLAS